MRILMPSMVAPERGTGGGWTCTQGIVNMTRAAFPQCRLEIVAAPEWRGAARRLRQATSLCRAALGGLPAKVGYTNCPEVREGLRRAGEVDLVLVNGADMMWTLDFLPPRTPAVVIGHNLEHELFAEQSRSLGSLGRRLAGRHREYEWAGIERAGNAVFVSRRDWELAKQSLPGVRIGYLPPVFSYEPPARRVLDRDELHIVLLANWNWWPNRDGARWFLDEIWPKVEGRHHLHAVGPGSEELARGRERVTGHGFVRDIRDAWRLGDFSVAPIRRGAGVKIKAAESLHNGVPVLTTRHVAEGLASEEGLRLADTTEEWISFLNGSEVREWAARPVPAAARAAYNIDRGVVTLRSFLNEAMA